MHTMQVLNVATREFCQGRKGTSTNMCPCNVHAAPRPRIKTEAKQKTADD